MREPLPIDEVLPEVAARIRAGPALVLEAPAGAGKTTRVPPALLDLVPGEVVVLEPRRLAARTAARRVAQELGERPGETVGYQVRFEDATGPRTRLRYVTEGVLTRRLLADPLLRGVSAVVLDEFHERHLQGDVALALLLQLLRGPRPDLKVLVMSATLDAGPVAAHLGCAIVRSEGRRFEVAVEHAERPDPRRLSEQVAAAVRKLTVAETSGDVLVFLPGAAEIRQAGEAVAELAAHRRLLVLPLHGDLPAEEQDRALAPASQRKINLSTNVAETSVTVPGVTAEMDSGLARIAAHSPWSGLPSLQVAKISRASAAQRAGRAGGRRPGVPSGSTRARTTTAGPSTCRPRCAGSTSRRWCWSCGRPGTIRRASPGSMRRRPPRWRPPKRRCAASAPSMPPALRPSWAGAAPGSRSTRASRGWCSRRPRAERPARAPPRRPRSASSAARAIGRPLRRPRAPT